MDNPTTQDKKRQESRRWLARRDVHVLFEDNHLLCVAKPAGLLSQGGPDDGSPALTDLLDNYRRYAEGKEGRAYIGLVHRLDRNTSGAMVVAKTSKAAGRLAALFRDRPEALEKSYLAWVDRPMDADEGTFEHRLRRERKMTFLAGEGDSDGRVVRLTWRVEARSHRASRVRIRLDTGMAHQIRAQFAIERHALVGDFKYKGPPGKRPGLHAITLAFPHPVGGAEVRVEAPLPDDLLRMNERLLLGPLDKGSPS